MKIQSSANGKPVMQANDYPTSPAAAYSSVARIADPDRPVIVVEANAEYLQAMRTEKRHNRYVWYSLLMIILLCLLSSILVALGFAYLRFYEAGDD